MSAFSIINRFFLWPFVAKNIECFCSANESAEKLLGSAATLTNVREGNAHKLFRDGVEVDSSTFTGSPGDTIALPLTIGAQQNSSTAANGFSAFFGGIIDEVEIFNRALTNSEIQGIFNADSAGKCQTLTVDIDIKPGSFPNSINLGSGGTTPVAILGSASLNVNDIDPDTLTLGTAGVKTVGKTDRTLCSVADVSGDFSAGPEGAPDGFLDLVCHFITMDIVPEEGATTATISGELNDGAVIEGVDSVNVVP